MQRFAGLLRRAQPWLWAIVAAVAVHSAWLMWMRGVLEHRAELSRPKAAAEDWAKLKLPSGPGVKIQMFYAAPGIVQQGESASICYSVWNARSVKLEPPVEKVWPSINRCISVQPEETTTYRLTATGADGTTEAEEFTLPVAPAPPRFIMFAQSEKKVKAGDWFTFCYGVKYASRVRLQPPLAPVAVAPQYCTRFRPPVSLDMTLEATGVVPPPAKHKFRVEVF